MIQVWIPVLVITLSAFAANFAAAADEFTHIKLGPVFEQYTRPAKLKSSSARSNLVSPAAIVSKTLLGGSGSPFPTDGEESPLYQEIRDALEASHADIGLKEVTQLDFINRQFNLGTENLSGFSWQKPFGAVAVHADRQVTPNLFGNNWLIQDTFTFDIEASSFLERANQAGLTAMNATEIGAFAGISFKRVYTYYHYANSYAEGLRADFSKLFLPFVKMNVRGVENMKSEEILKREDHWTARAGGLITTPPLYNVSFSAGVLAQYAHEQMVSVQSFTVAEEKSEKIRMNVKAKTALSAGATLSLQLDFFKLLKLTILNVDLTYEYASAKEATLALNSAQWKSLPQDPVKLRELKSLMRGAGKVDSLEPYVVRLDEAESSALQSRGSLLIWGKMQKSKTEQLRIIANGAVNVFYKNYNQSVKVVQNIFSRLFSAAVYKLLKLPIGTKNMALLSRQVNLEYQASGPQALNPKNARVESTGEFSFVVNQSYEAASTHRWIDRRYKNDAIDFVDAFTTLSKDHKTFIRQEHLKGPMRIESNLRVEKAGLDYFLAQNPDKIYRSMAVICDSELIEEWSSFSSRRALINDFSVDEFCVKDLGRDYEKFMTDLQLHNGRPSLSLFKKFLTAYFKLIHSLNDLNTIFGSENTFIHGQLKATSSTGADFVTSFSTGQFRGLGVIDNFKRLYGSRTPASIVSE